VGQSLTIPRQSRPVRQHSCATGPIVMARLAAAPQQHNSLILRCVAVAVRGLLSCILRLLLQPPSCTDYTCTSGTRKSDPPAGFGLALNDETCCDVSWRLTERCNCMFCVQQSLLFVLCSTMIVISSLQSSILYICGVFAAYCSGTLRWHCFYHHDAQAGTASQGCTMFNRVMLFARVHGCYSVLCHVRVCVAVGQSSAIACYIVQLPHRPDGACVRACMHACVYVL
jgi:hypothetical protein